MIMMINFQYLCVALWPLHSSEARFEMAIATVMGKLLYAIMVEKWTMTQEWFERFLLKSRFFFLPCPQV